VQYASLYLIGAAILVVIGLAITLNRVVLNPLAQMTRHAVEVGRHEDLTTRLNFERDDEIGVLAREFDRMVERVAQSRGQLVDQSFKAGFAELARGVLHNLGNAMTPIGVRLATLRTRLASVTTEDLELVVSELTRSDADPQRKADLEEFARLACGQLAGTLKAARQDIELIAGQTSLVQGALAEQTRATGNEHVMESVRLRELLSRALDVVPDRARQQLDIRVDPSLDEVGIVHVPRTVLSLVLQNFVINAADSIRETGRARGSMLITAEILDQGDARQLVIRCRDDGVGIAPENLQRVFEKGFSTKSRATNFGIGLHWCANAVGALGGRVWAASAGMGQGATLHVMVPLTAPQNVATTLAA
jgi:signal transduction histidine kinase